ncbi:hypothetical protein M413DRAFT_445457 [Hebeloma cylindrosporum]|uniref:Uncharacterized protein n=1 Tax=Hebeloma cylindrosporum TaxID=76867 RepID=A0A0C2XUW7_HEBCY|nr:hypothetical protein M413DRAFT_445457 [Hebeloma cylindrosporum h7]
MKKHYLLFSVNCYYYAGTLIKALEVKYESNLRVVVQTTGSEALDRECGLKKDQSGKWHGIPIYDKEDVHMPPVLARWKNDLDAFNYKTSAKLRAREEEKAVDARIKALEEEVTRLKRQIDAAKAKC